MQTRSYEGRTRIFVIYGDLKKLGCYKLQKQNSILKSLTRTARRNIKRQVDQKKQEGHLIRYLKTRNCI